MAEKIELGKAYVQVVPSINGVPEELNEVFGSSGDSAGEQFSNNFSGILKGAGIAGVGVAAFAIGKKIAEVVTQSVEQYGSYEQLIGGVEKLFGDSALTIEQYAQSAYKTAGISANEYMDQITSFSASLISSLDGDTTQAAELGNQAVLDMSDNANVFGSDIASIQNAYQGFAKQNYTMLDNLKLGYGGTKEEASRLLEDAEKLDSSFKAQRDESGKVTLAFADMINAIHIVQEEMQITGTTAKEAAGTLEGSAASSKAAWENMQTALADPNGDTEKATKRWIRAVQTEARNKGAAIETTLSNIPTAAELAIGSALDSLSMMFGNLDAEDFKLMDEVNASLEKSEDLADAFETKIDSVTSKLQEQLQPLDEAQVSWDALKNVVDENGKVRSGHLKDAEYYIGQLNSVLGTELQLEGDILSEYSSQSKAIDEILEKKRIEAELEANNQMFAEAQLALQDASAQKAQNDTLIEFLKEEIRQRGLLHESTRIQREELAELQTANEGLSKTIDTSGVLISQYYENIANSASGNTDKILILDSEIINSADSVTEGKVRAFEAQIAKENEYIATLTANRTEANAEYIDAEIQSAEERKKNAQSHRDAEIRANQGYFDKLYIQQENERTEFLNRAKFYYSEEELALIESHNSMIRGTDSASEALKTNSGITASEIRQNFSMSLYNEGYNAVSSFGVGVDDSKLLVAERIGLAANEWISRIKNTFKFGSPSKVMRAFGQGADESFALGFEDYGYSLLAAQNFADEFLNSVGAIENAMPSETPIIGRNSINSRSNSSGTVNNYVINGITYSNGDEIQKTLQNIVRTARLERRA